MKYSSTETGITSAQDKRPALVTLTIRVFMVMGLVFMAMSVYFYRDTMLFMEHAQRLDGTVVGFVKGSGGWFPIVRYTGPRGVDLTLHCRSGSYPPDYFVGQQVGVLVDPADPQFEQAARIASFLGVWGVPVFLIGFGVLFFTVGVVVRFFHTRPGLLAAWLD